MGLSAGVNGEPSWARCNSIHRKNIVFDVFTVVGLVTNVKRESYGGRVNDIVCL